MSEQIIIRSVKQYFNEFIYENRSVMNNPLDRARIKLQLLDAFRKEVFEQIVLKLGPEAASISRDELANIEFVHNILTNAFRKWRRLCMLATDAGLVNWLSLDDLKQILEEDKAEDAHIAEEEKEAVEA